MPMYLPVVFLTGLGRVEFYPPLLLTNFFFFFFNFNQVRSPLGVQYVSTGGCQPEGLPHWSCYNHPDLVNGNPFGDVIPDDVDCSQLSGTG